ncbi:MAG: hypothetical protein GXP30_14535 [Verrucomicrobia bacterium]|nr:hypothetical protein [Verrucomicrobiota bacterium]
MKTKTLLTSLATSLMLSSFAIGGEPVNYNNMPSSGALFGPENTVGAFAMYVKPDQDAVDKKWGAGIVGEHFFSSYFGLAGSASWVDLDQGGLWHNYVGDAIFRVPIESARMAPYALAGVGTIYGDGDFSLVGRIGAGIDFRITQSLGLFGDWIYHFPEGNTGLSGENYATTRIGLKFAF